MPERGCPHSDLCVSCPPQELRERVLRGKYRVPFYMSTDCENILRRFLVLNPAKRCTLEVRGVLGGAQGGTGPEGGHRAQGGHRAGAGTAGKGTVPPQWGMSPGHSAPHPVGSPKLAPPS